MAKRGTPGHPKTLRLAATLGIDNCFALGVLEALWQWAAKYAMNGDLSKWRAADVAQGIGYRGDPELLIKALIECGWLDRLDGRIVIHDVQQHADNTWKQCLVDSGTNWWDGTPPRLNSIGRPRKDQLHKTPEKLQENSRKSPQPKSKSETESKPKRGQNPESISEALDPSVPSASQIPSREDALELISSVRKRMPA